MQTEGGQKLTYRVRMYFEALGGYRGQQHALSLWQAVRSMEKKINVKDKTLISDKNQINVNNTEVCYNSTKKDSNQWKIFVKFFFVGYYSWCREYFTFSQ